MDYYEIIFTYNSSIQIDLINDLLAYELGNFGYDSFMPADNGLKAYISANLYNESALNDMLKNFPLQDIGFCHTKQLIMSRNWNEEWEQHYFKPVCIESKCIVRASFHPTMEGFDYTILIDPKMSFGTGNHATTSLMLNELLDLDLQGKTFLDMGCGTAVLAILAAMKKALRIIAIDIDEWAYQNAIENCLLNNTEHIEVILGGAEQISRFGTFDYIFANINRNILLNDIHLYAPALKPEGSLFMSGFYKDDIPAIEEVSGRNGLFFTTYTERDNWVVLTVKKCNI